MLTLSAATDPPRRRGRQLPACAGLSAVLHVVMLAVVIVVHPAGRGHRLPVTAAGVDADRRAATGPPVAMVWVPPESSAPERAPVANPVLPPASPQRLDATPTPFDATIHQLPSVKPFSAEVLRPPPVLTAENGSSDADLADAAAKPATDRSETATAGNDGPREAPMTPLDINDLSVRFVKIEDGQWLEWLHARGGLVGLTSRRDGRIESLYSAAGEPVLRTGWAPGEYWPLEIDHPNRIAALQVTLKRAYYRSGGRNRPWRRVFALFPHSFRREVLAAIRASGAAADAFLVSFMPAGLHVVPVGPASGDGEQRTVTDP